MRSIENQCVDCGLPCIASCKYKSVEVVHCDRCGREAFCNVDGEDLCEQCFDALINDEYADMDVEERARKMGIRYELF